MKLLIGACFNQKGKRNWYQYTVGLKIGSTSAIGYCSSAIVRRIGILNRLLLSRVGTLLLSAMGNIIAFRIGGTCRFESS